MLSHPVYIGVVVHYVRPRQVAYVREALQAVVREVVGQEDLDLETDPVAVRSTVLSFLIIY
jgi:Ras GTPase-activating-like protein IQGAP2/3